MMETLETLTVAWNVIARAIRPSKYQDDDNATPSSQDVNAAVELMHHHGMAHIIKEWFLVMYEEDLQNAIIPEFWSNFQDKQKSNFWRFPKAVKELYQHMQEYSPSVSQLQCLHEDLLTQADVLPRDALVYVKSSRRPLLEEMHVLGRSMLLSKWPVDFRTVLVDFYGKAFKVFQAKQKDFKAEDEYHETVLQCPGCDNEADICHCQEFLDTFYTTTQHLTELELLQTVVGDIPMSVAHEYVEQYIQDTCKGNFEASYLVPLKEWLDHTVMLWLSAVYCEEKADTSAKVMLSGFAERLSHVLYETYAEVRLDQLFNIIIEFPESQAALEDLKECLDLTGLRPKLISSLRSSLETRLLHPGVNTADILTAYISAIKALRVLDPTGVVLQLVCEPVCKYLRSRDDTVRCIVSSLTDDSCGELASELMKGAPLMLEDSYHSDEEVEDWEKWHPDPVDADPAKTSKSQRSSDIISMLVNIYGSKELFVNEYRTLLADRLLSTFSYNTEREIRYLELLKLRFGESQLHYCEVMLKDVADSKRINAHINSGEVPNYDNLEFPVSTMILSAQFWPTFREEKLKLPDCIWQKLKNFTTAFETLKGNRTLVWKPHLGMVYVEVTLKDRKMELGVTPVHATIIWHFQEKSKWTVNELSAVMHIPSSALRRKITFWQSHGVLQEEETDVFVLVEEQKGHNQDVVVIEEETESVTASSQDQREEELQMFWSFIVGMLTNMESLPLERIHTMLRMFAMQGPSTSECSIHELRQFLDRKVRERKLLYSGGLYRLPRFEA